MEIDLTGKVALVTGASRGIGRAIALLLGRAGAACAVNYLSSKEEAEEVAAFLGDRGLVVQADLGDADDVEAMVSAVTERFGRLDILVNNAAVYQPNPVDDDFGRWRERWERTIGVNLLGAAHASFLAVQVMRRQGGGKIVNVASRAGFRGEPGCPDYGASKAGMINLTRSLTRACAHEGIVSTCVAPGFVDTAMARPELEEDGAALVEEIPLGRVATAEEVAEAVLFLVSPLADYLAGATIDVNGGSYFH